MESVGGEPLEHGDEDGRDVDEDEDQHPHGHLHTYTYTVNVCKLIGTTTSSTF